MNYLIEIGSSRTQMFFNGKTKKDDNYYYYPQSLVKQLQVVLLKHKIKYHEFDMQIKINFGIIKTDL